MKPIARTEAEMADLRKAADYVPVFTRPIGQKEERIKIDRGCFNCRHLGDNMDPTRRYSTMWLWGFTGDEETGPKAKPFISFVFSFDDSFYQDILNSNHWINKGYYEGRYNKIVQNYTIQNRIFKHSDGQLYVRHYSTPTKQYLHHNGRITLKNFVPKNMRDCTFQDVVMYTTPLLVPGVYAPPRLNDEWTANAHNSAMQDHTQWHYANEDAARRVSKALSKTRGVDMTPVKGLKTKKKEVGGAEIPTAPSVEPITYHFQDNTGGSDPDAFATFTTQLINQWTGTNIS